MVALQRIYLDLFTIYVFRGGGRLGGGGGVIGYLLQRGGGAGHRLLASTEQVKSSRVSLLFV